MSELPDGWCNATISELALYVSRGKSPKYAERSGLPVVNQKCIRWTGVDETYVKFVDPETWSQWSNERYLHPNDILWNSTGTGTIGRAALFNKLPSYDQAVVDSHVTIVRLGHAIEPSFLFRFIQSPAVQDKIEDMQSGSTNQVELNRSEIVSTLVPVPPLAEQKRIVAKVDSLTAQTARARKELDRIPTLIARYKQRLLALAFFGIEAEDSITLGELAERITKGESPKWQGFEYLEQGILFLRSQNVGWGKLLLNDKVFLDPAFNLKREKSTLQSGDILLNIVGASVGRTAIATEEIAGANCNQAVAIIRMKQRDPTDQSYVCWWLQSPEAQIAINEGVVDVARANFSLASIRAMSLPWPSKSSRTEIVRRIETAFAWLDRLAVEHTSATKLLPKLDAAILAKAFRGELVPQDPNDEPASVLLERVKAQKTAVSAKVRGTDFKIGLKLRGGKPSIKPNFQ